jgi:hypothetical protein
LENKTTNNLPIRQANNPDNPGNLAPAMIMPEVKLFACSASKDLSKEIAEHYKAPLGDTKLARFSDGEMQTIINESVRGSYTFHSEHLPAPR